jgi:hypothetical protein
MLETSKGGFEGGMTNDGLVGGRDEEAHGKQGWIGKVSNEGNERLCYDDGRRGKKVNETSTDPCEGLGYIHSKGQETVDHSRLVKHT